MSFSKKYAAGAALALAATFFAACSNTNTPKEVTIPEVSDTDSCLTHAATDKGLITAAQVPAIFYQMLGETPSNENITFYFYTLAGKELQEEKKSCVARYGDKSKLANRPVLVVQAQFYQDKLIRYGITEDTRWAITDADSCVHGKISEIVYASADGQATVEGEQLQAIKDSCVTETGAPLASMKDKQSGTYSIPSNPPAP